MKNKLTESFDSKSLEMRVSVIQKDRVLPYRHALVVANMAEHLLRLLKKGEVHFSYTRQDNTVCYAKGTLLNYTSCFGKPYASLPSNQFLLYYDLYNNQWRTFHLAFLLKVIEKY